MPYTPVLGIEPETYKPFLQLYPNLQNGRLKENPALFLNKLTDTNLFKLKRFLNKIDIKHVPPS